MRKLMLMLILLLFASSAEANVTDSLLSSKAERIMGEMSHVKTAVQSYMRFVSYLDRTNNTTIRRPAMNMENFKLSWLQETLPAGDERPETALYPEGLGEVPNKAFLLTSLSFRGVPVPSASRRKCECHRFLAGDKGGSGEEQN